VTRLREVARGPLLGLRLADLGFGEYVHDQPSGRFPVYTRGNIGEVWPFVMYPLSASLAREAPFDPFADAFVALGALTAEEAGPQNGSPMYSAVFSGYAYLNLTATRLVAIRSIGSSIETSDRTYVGAEAGVPHADHPDDRSIRRSAALAVSGLSMMRAKDTPMVHRDKLRVAGWRSALTPVADCSDDQLVERLHSGVGFMTNVFQTHVDISGKAGGAAGLLTDFCAKQLHDESVALTLLTGIGNVESAEPARALWNLAQMVRNDPELTAAFDAGPDGLRGRLVGTPFAASLSEFQNEFGSRGPNEWDICSPSWGTDARMPLALVDRLRAAGPEQSPDARADVARQRREDALADANSQLNVVTRWLLQDLLRVATMYSQARERQKTTVVKIVHEMRLALNELARRIVGHAGEPDDINFVYWHELAAYRANPGNLAPDIAARRATRAELEQRVPPMIFDGQISSPTTWPLRDSGSDQRSPASSGATLTGTSGNAGTVTGLARVVEDPFDDVELGPGTILIAPHTDPSWTPLFLGVDAVVVSVGGQMSHAVIVARELGIPCVLNISDATKVIPNGARITVNGADGTVTVH